jgi:hypothetical protein
MTDIDKKSDAALEKFFVVAKAADPVPSGDLMSRIMADAVAVQSQQAQTVTTQPTPRRFGEMLGDMFGGWAGASTLVACVGLGLLVGFVSPETVLSYVPGAADASLDGAFGLYFDDEL